ncbi:MAG: hypothetical protein ABIG66_05620 [Candidatus Kerfeldbacteria bacterium]
MAEPFRQPKAPTPKQETKPGEQPIPPADLHVIEGDQTNQADEVPAEAIALGEHVAAKAQQQYAEETKANLEKAKESLANRFGEVVTEHLREQERKAVREDETPVELGGNVEVIPQTTIDAQQQVGVTAEQDTKDEAKTRYLRLQEQLADATQQIDVIKGSNRFMKWLRQPTLNRQEKRLQAAQRSMAELQQQYPDIQKTTAEVPMPASTQEQARATLMQAAGEAAEELQLRTDMKETEQVIKGVDLNAERDKQLQIRREALQAKTALGDRPGFFRRAARAEWDAENARLTATMKDAEHRVYEISEQVRTAGTPKMTVERPQMDQAA